MNAPHTQGLLSIAPDAGSWSANYDGYGTSSYRGIKSGEGSVVALAVAHDTDFSFDTDPLENARRLVACWNACNGITTERLEDLGRPLMQHLIGADERAARMVKERDELLESLEALVNERQPLGIDRPTYQAALKVIDKFATAAATTEAAITPTGGAE